MNSPTTPNFEAVARFYDADYRNYRDDIQMVGDLAQEAGSRVLELGCGTGRLLVPLAAVGCTVTGVDSSPALLEIARRKAAASGYARRIRLVQEDLRTFRLDRGDFDFAFTVSNTLMHLTTQADQLAVLRNAQRHLRPGGFLLVDLFNPDIPHLAAVSGLQELADRWVDAETGAQVLKWSVRRLDLARQHQETLFLYEEIFPDGRVQRTLCPFTLRFLWPSEGALLLQMAGFTVEEILGDFDGNPYDNGSERLIFLARRQ